MGSRASLGAPKRRSGAAQGQQQLLGPCCWQRKSPGRGEPPKNARFVLSHSAAPSEPPGRGWGVPRLCVATAGSPHPAQAQLLGDNPNNRPRPPRNSQQFPPSADTAFQRCFCCPQVFSFSWFKTRAGKAAAGCERVGAAPAPSSSEGDTAILTHTPWDCSLAPFQRGFQAGFSFLLSTLGFAGCSPGRQTRG